MNNNEQGPYNKMNKREEEEKKNKKVKSDEHFKTCVDKFIFYSFLLNKLAIWRMILGIEKLKKKSFMSKPKKMRPKSWTEMKRSSALNLHQETDLKAPLLWEEKIHLHCLNWNCFKHFKILSQVGYRYINKTEDYLTPRVRTTSFLVFYSKNCVCFLTISLECFSPFEFLVKF